MPLYNCMILLKPHVDKGMLMDLVSKVGKHIFARNGVLTDIKSFGTIHLGYGIRKRDGRHYEGKLMQMTMMVPPSFHKELHYLNKEDRLLRWLVVKHRDVKLGYDFNRNEGFLKHDILEHSNRMLNAASESDDGDSDYEEVDG